MKTDELLDKYFEGQTTCEEERELRRRFTAGEVPEHLLVYKPLFDCIDSEISLAENKGERKDVQPAVRPARRFTLRHVAYAAAGIAAALLVCVISLRSGAGQESAPQCYVIIDGQYYDDPQLVQAKAMESLRNVGFSDEELRETIKPNILP